MPDLSIPPENAYIIIEVDGCMEGWGGIVKWKRRKEDPRSTEKVCAYASGKFDNVQSTIDAEINACINTLDKMKIYYLDKQEVTIRTDCGAIVSFYNKSNSNKASRVRWMKFADAITGTGINVKIEHIDGKNNVLADSLSRLVNSCVAVCTLENVNPKMEEVIKAAVAATGQLMTGDEAWEMPQGKQHGTSLMMELKTSITVSQISDLCQSTLTHLQQDCPLNTAISKRKQTQHPLIPAQPTLCEESPAKWKKQHLSEWSKQSKRLTPYYNVRDRYVQDQGVGITLPPTYGHQSHQKSWTPKKSYKEPGNY